MNMPKPLAVLIVEDSESDAQLMVRMLEKAGFTLTLEQVESAAQMRAALEKQTWEIVISDFSLPELDGFGALKVLHETGLDIPFIVVSGTMGEETAVAMMKAGAHDYVMKGNLSRLVPAIERELIQAEERRVRKQAEEKCKENIRLLKIAGEKAKLGGWRVNLRNNLCIWSDETAAILERPAGYSPIVEEVMSYYAPEWREKITQVFTECVQNGIHYDEEMEIITAKGKRVWVRTIGEPVEDEAGKIIEVHGAFQDITEQKRVEKELTKAKEKAEGQENIVKSILDNLQDAFFQADLNGCITYINPTAPKMYGYSFDELIGKKAEILYAEPHDREKLIAVLRQLGKVTDWNTHGFKRWLQFLGFNECAVYQGKRWKNHRNRRSCKRYIKT